MIQTFHSESPEQTKTFAKKIASQLKSGDVLALSGDLAAGKTTFTQGLSEFFHIEEQVTSPTFTLINEYNGDMTLFHFDCYRLKKPEEIIFLGFEDYLERDGIVIIEWPEIIEAFIPEDAMIFTFKYDDDNENGRRIEIESKRNFDL